jgi:hypothetical protein
LQENKESIDENNEGVEEMEKSKELQIEAMKG